MFYEGNGIKDTLKQMIKKYRTLTTFSDLKLIANRFQDLASRSSKINIEYPVRKYDLYHSSNQLKILTTQMTLFNMELVNVDTEFLLKRSTVLADISSVHKMVVSFEEVFMNSKNQCLILIPFKNFQIELSM